MRKFRNYILPLLLVSINFITGYGQITTSSITGFVKDEKNTPLAGATIEAVHTPSGTKYATAATKNGQFTLPNLRTGGPYTVKVSFIGFTTQTTDSLTLTLGSPLVLNVTLESSNANLTEVTVTTRAKGSIISSQRNGASTFIPQRLMQSAPTINRNVQDLARLTPQVSALRAAADGSSTGLSFGGQNNRYNQFTIDGANATDAFGLTSSGTNGAAANINPISIETIQEVQIVLSPYDVTLGGFTGGGINAVTKSGTNTTHGSLYGFLQNEGFVGKSAPYNKTITKNTFTDFKNTTYGGSIGGAIIKNKLFYYANAERYEKTTPLAFNPRQAGSGSKFNVDTLEQLRNYIKNTWNFDPGDYGNITKTNESISFFGRIDYNINSKHTLTVRHSYVKGSNDIISRTATSAVFSNGGYKFRNTTNSTVIELNSSFSSKASNVLRLTYNAIRDKRETPFFPSLQINNYDATQKVALQYLIGAENSSAVNGLDQDIFTLTDNFTLYKGKHTITIGTNDEFFNSKNFFLQNYYGNYIYGQSTTTATTNLSNFELNAPGGNGALQTYNVNFSTSADPKDKAPANLHAAQFGIYAQDNWSINEKFKLTYGLRIDMPVFFNKPDANTNFDTTSSFAVFGAKTEQMPKPMPLFSPRVGFNWDVKGNATTQVRGGAGLFTGRIPFVWISNQMSNTGTTSLAYTATTAERANIKFNFDPNDVHAGAYLPGKGAPTVINVIDRKFKFPQVFRANLALDQKLPFWGLIGTVEAIFTKTVNNANYQNLNLTYFPESSVKLGSTTRNLWTTRVNSNFTDVLQITNTSKGYGYNLTAQLQKPYSKGWSGMIAYTYGHSTSLSDLTSSVAYSNWRFAYTTNGLNFLDLANSNFDLGSRIVGYVSKEFKYAQRFATTFTLIYTGQSGQRISYLYSRSINGDDISNGSVQNSVVYIPKNFAEANFADIKNSSGVITTSAAQQWADFQNFVLTNKYLKNHIGRNTTRNGDRMPFESHFDLRITQDIYLVKGHKLQVIFDLLNVGNLLNSKWGWSYNLSNQSVTLLTAVTSPGTGATASTQNGTAVTPSAANPYFQFNINNMTKIRDTYRPYTIGDFTSRWNSQLGLRYSF